MIQLIKNMLGMGPKVDFAKLIQDGAVIIDVRTPNEFKSGNVKGSINIPIDALLNNLSKVDKKKTIITCCASGTRSGMAKRLLKSNGYDVHNGGSWTSVRNYIK